MRGKSLVIILLVGSLCANSYLSFKLWEVTTDLEWAEEQALGSTEERDQLMDLIPDLQTTITRKELAQVLSERFPGEPVDIVGQLVQWRLFQFWFRPDSTLGHVQRHQGSIVSVIWSS